MQFKIAETEVVSKVHKLLRDDERGQLSAELIDQMDYEDQLHDVLCLTLDQRLVVEVFRLFRKLTTAPISVPERLSLRSPAGRSARHAMALCVAWHEVGFSERDIAARTQIPRSTVGRRLREWANGMTEQEKDRHALALEWAKRHVAEALDELDFDWCVEHHRQAKKAARKRVLKPAKPV